MLNEKFECIDALKYPKDKLHVFFGSDNSSDNSNDMLLTFSSKRQHVTFVPFDERQGKIGVINQLGQLAIDKFGSNNDHILVYNDANVMIPPDSLEKLVGNFSDKRIALVDANMLSNKLKKSGISLAERDYMNREVMLKHYEGKAWGTLQGAFGGYYGLRSDYFVEVPQGYLVDDFYISFSAMTNGGAAINDLGATCYEGASDDIWQEFRRKARISAGNFQNLRKIMSQWSEVSSRLRFCFISHKVLRWIGPFLMIIGFISSLALALYGFVFYEYITAAGLLLFVAVPLIDLIFISINIHFGVLRKVRYFVMMNIALLTGFFRYVKGIQNGFWEPPKRV